MAKGTIKVGDEVMIRATVTAIWKDGHVTVQMKSAGQKVTLPNNSEIEQTSQARAGAAQAQRANGCSSFH